MYTRKNSRHELWSKDISYNYGSAAVQEEPETTEEEPSEKNKQRETKILRRQVVFLFLLGVLCYFGNVVLSQQYIVKSNELVQLKKVEAECLDENETLKIDVERLKSPERITSIASKELGMSTARSNIYVRVDGTDNAPGKK